MLSTVRNLKITRLEGWWQADQEELYKQTLTSRHVCSTCAHLRVSTVEEDLSNHVGKMSCHRTGVLVFHPFWICVLVCFFLWAHDKNGHISRDVGYISQQCEISGLTSWLSLIGVQFLNHRCQYWMFSIASFSRGTGWYTCCWWMALELFHCESNFSSLV